MARYVVTMPVTGFVSMEVDAVDTDAAIHAFWDSDALPDQPDVWQFTEHVVRGGVCTALKKDVQVHSLDRHGTVEPARTGCAALTGSDGEHCFPGLVLIEAAAA